MKANYSIVRFISNPLSRENIAFGLIMESNNKLMFRFSDEKLDFIYKLSPSNAKLIQYNIAKIKDSLHAPSNNDKVLIGVEGVFNFEYLERLSSYNNGLVQFDKPTSINLEFNDEKFNSFFEKYISLNIQKETIIKPIDTKFHDAIMSSFYTPLKSQIDVDLTIKKKEIPSLYFNYHLDGLGVNGAIYSVKAIDLNSNKSLNQIQKDISEFESFNQHVDFFAKSKGISGDSKHYLVIDQYSGSKPSYLDLYSIISNKANISLYELISTDELDKVVKLIRKRKAHKFTEEFLSESK